jgi:hypothetical protein
MSGPEAKNPAPAGISSPEEIDVAALFERLREELRRGAVQGDSRGAEFASTRALAERFWPVTAERPAGGGPKGAVKRFLRKLMRWYVEPLAADQRVFNDSVLKLVDALSERADSASVAREQAVRLVRELQERVERLERRPAFWRQPRAGGACHRCRSARGGCDPGLLRLREPDAGQHRIDPRAPAPLHR